MGDWTEIKKILDELLPTMEARCTRGQLNYGLAVSSNPHKFIRGATQDLGDLVGAVYGDEPTMEIIADIINHVLLLELNLRQHD